MKNLLKTLGVFYGFEAKKKGWFTLFLVLIALASFIGSLGPYFYKLLVDALPDLNYQKLLTILLVFIGFRIASLLIEAVSFVIGDYISFEGGIDARVSIFKHIHDLDFAFHSSKSTGTLISVIKRGDGAYYSLHHAIHHRILDIIVAFIVMMYFFGSIDIRILLLVAVAFIVTLIITKFLVGYNIKTRNLFNDEEDNISHIIVDNIINFETVKLFAKENWERERLNKAFINWRKTLWKHANSFRFLDLSLGSLINLSIFLVLLISLRLSSELKLSIGDFVLVAGFINGFFPRLWDLVYSFRDIAKNYADIQKYFGLLDYDIQIKDTKDPVNLTSVTGEIEFRNLYFSYKEGQKNAVNGIDLKVRQGQSVALVGRSGSGKTTLIKLLMRFYDVDKGELTLDGINVKDFTKSQLRSFMGVVPQEPVLFNNTITYNIGYGKEETSQNEIIAAAKLANIHEFIDGLPKKYDTQVGERGIKLSGGQKQRLAIARMILSDPDIIIFDEATSQLDSENERLIQEAFWRVARDKTTIIIAHRLSTAMRADKIVVFEKGKIVEIGSHAFLLSKKESLYKHFWNLQTNIE